MTVKKAILKSADQTEYNKIEAVIVGDTKDMKAGDIKVTNTILDPKVMLPVEVPLLTMLLMFLMQRAV